MSKLAVYLAACPILGIVTTVLAQAPVPAPPAADAGRILAPQISTSLDSDKEIAGLARQSQPVVLTWDQVYALATIRARSGTKALSPTLEPETFARDRARFEVADFARFQKEFRGSAAFQDPGPDVFSLLNQLQAIDHARRQLAVRESLRKLLQEQVQGESSGLSRLDLDAVMASLIQCRQKLDRRIREFRDGLDELKVALGLSPRAAVILDRKSIGDFEEVFVAVANWTLNPNRRLDDMTRQIAELPEIGDVVLDGRPVLHAIENDPDRMEKLMTNATRLALDGHDAKAAVPASDDARATLEVKIRRRIRLLAETQRAYTDATRRYELAFRLRDQSFERMHAPAYGPSRSQSLERLLVILNDEVDAEDQIVHLWTNFCAERLRLYRELGVMPFTDWASFYADLSARRTVAKPQSG
jgi:hypothetical protein